MDTIRIPAVIIGAGQAGLAAAHELVRRGLVARRDFVILDANDGPGGAWRHRWDSLTLGKAHGIADLPGLAMERPDPSIPARLLVTDYYGAYEQAFNLAVVRPVRVEQVSSANPADPHAPLTVRTDSGTYVTDVVVNATGTWDSPYIPYVPGIETFAGTQLHTKDYTQAMDFAGQRTLVVGGGLSAIQFLLELEPVTDTLWATRRPPNFTRRWHDASWGLDVEKAVRAQAAAGEPPASVVRTTGIGLVDDYVSGVDRGLLVSRGMFDRITPTGVIFTEPDAQLAQGLGPSASDDLVLPQSWQPYPAGTDVNVDVIFWNTGFRAALRHLAPMKLRGTGRGTAIEMVDEVTPAADARILLVGYASSASTLGANRAGRLAGRHAARRLAASQRV